MALPCGRVACTTIGSATLRDFADVFPLKLPPGLPVNLVTDYRIDVLPDYKPLAHWLYRMSPEDKELNAQL